MSEFEHTTNVEASPERVWDFVADVRNLPKYLPTTHSAEPAQGERVEVKGEAQGHEYDSEGYFREDRDNYRLEWGADEGYYTGWLEIAENGSGSDVTVHLTFTGAPPHGEGEPPGDNTSENAPDRDDVQEGLVSALESIKNFVEGDRPDTKDESRAATYDE